MDQKRRPVRKLLEEIYKNVLKGPLENDEVEFLAVQYEPDHGMFIELWNTKVPIGNNDEGSTFSRSTLEKMGVELPRPPIEPEEIGVEDFEGSRY